MLVTMSDKELSRINVIQSVVEKRMFGSAMHELNIQTICASTCSAKGRVERAHLTLQDRMVKELRLRGISSVDAANDYADEFMADYNRRFAKAPRHDFDVHRLLETDDDLAASFTWREPRRVSKSLTVQYDKVLYLIEDWAYRRPGEAQRYLYHRGRIHLGAVPGQDSIEAGTEHVNQLHVSGRGLWSGGAEAHLEVCNGGNHNAMTAQ